MRPPRAPWLRGLLSCFSSSQSECERATLSELSEAEPKQRQEQQACAPSGMPKSEPCGLGAAAAIHEEEEEEGTSFHSTAEDISVLNAAAASCQEDLHGHARLHASSRGRQPPSCAPSNCHSHSHSYDSHDLGDTPTSEAGLSRAHGYEDHAHGPMPGREAPPPSPMQSCSGLRADHAPLLSKHSALQPALTFDDASSQGSLATIAETQETMNASVSAGGTVSGAGAAAAALGRTSSDTIGSEVAPSVEVQQHGDQPTLGLGGFPLWNPDRFSRRRSEEEMQRVSPNGLIKGGVYSGIYASRRLSGTGGPSRSGLAVRSTAAPGPMAWAPSQVVAGGPMPPMPPLREELYAIATGGGDLLPSLQAPAAGAAAYERQAETSPPQQQQLEQQERQSIQDGGGHSSAHSFLRQPQSSSLLPPGGGGSSGSFPTVRTNSTPITIQGGGTYVTCYGGGSWAHTQPSSGSGTLRPTVLSTALAQQLQERRLELQRVQRQAEAERQALQLRQQQHRWHQQHYRQYYEQHPPPLQLQQQQQQQQEGGYHNGAVGRPRASSHDRPPAAVRLQQQAPDRPGRSVSLLMLENNQDLEEERDAREAMLKYLHDLSSSSRSTRARSHSHAYPHPLTAAYLHDSSGSGSPHVAAGSATSQRSILGNDDDVCEQGTSSPLKRVHAAANAMAASQGGASEPLPRMLGASSSMRQREARARVSPVAGAVLEEPLLSGECPHASAGVGGKKRATEGGLYIR